MKPITLSNRAAVEEALANDALVPPKAPPSIGGGTMAALRDGMARFSGPDTHGQRRGAVITAIDGLAGMHFADLAEQRTARRLSRLSAVVSGRFEAIGELGFVVPTQVLGSALGVAESDLADLVIETASLARVIGRGEPVTEQHEGHADRLLERFGDRPGGAAEAVAAASLLYQNHDATAALLAAHLHALATGQERQSSLTQTVRVATTDCAIGGANVCAGQQLALDLRSSGFEFGSGPHVCPGREIAEQMVQGICAALDVAGCRPVAAEMTFNQDGRPSTIPMSAMETT